MSRVGLAEGEGKDAGNPGDSPCQQADRARDWASQVLDVRLLHSVMKFWESSCR